MNKKIIDGLKFLSDFYHFIIYDEEFKKLIIKDVINIYNITFAYCVMGMMVENNILIFIFALISFMINILRIFYHD